MLGNIHDTKCRHYRANMISLVRSRMAEPYGLVVSERWRVAVLCGQATVAYSEVLGGRVSVADPEDRDDVCRHPTAAA